MWLCVGDGGGERKTSVWPSDRPPHGNGLHIFFLLWRKEENIDVARICAVSRLCSVKSEHEPSRRKQDKKLSSR